jgi:hypothetical protein
MLLFAATVSLSKPRSVLLGLILVFLVYFIYRFFAVQAARRKSGQPAPTPAPVRTPQKGPVLRKLDASAQPASPAVEGLPGPTRVATPSFRTLNRPPSMTSDLLHATLIILAVGVAIGFVLVVIPQATFDDMARNLQERRAGVQREQLAFLYLGDEVQDKEFQIRGVVRNITDQPLEKIDAALRLYAVDGRLLQTTLVRMDKESFAPDETAEFRMVYPNYDQNIGSYSVDFVTRDGVLVNYKDMRAARPRE